MTLALLVFCGGCGKEQRFATQFRAAASAYAEALEAYQSQDYATALEYFTAAIDESGLDADHYADALLRTAECHVELGNFNEAAAVLDLLEPNAPEPEQVHLVRCKLYSKQGDAAKARSAYEAARAINPSIEPPVEL
jgi:tetratricopeptide (TPR) repeat protein